MPQTDVAHDAADESHSTGHDSGHGHGPAAESLGPPDLMAWAYAIAGGAVGVVVAVALYAAAAA